jgi:hypothetical protein
VQKKAAVLRPAEHRHHTDDQSHAERLAKPPILTAT